MSRPCLRVGSCRLISNVCLSGAICAKAWRPTPCGTAGRRCRFRELTAVYPANTVKAVARLWRRTMTVKSSISLTDDQYAFAKALVESGRFPSVSAVLQRGIEVLRQQIEDEALERAALAELLKQRRAGRFLSASKMDDRLAAMLARKRRARAARI